MSGARSPAGYTLTQIILHWVIAALVVFQLLVNEGMQDAFDDRVDGDEVSDYTGAALHIAVGVTILVLALVRLWMRWRHGAPAAHRDKPAPIIWLGYATHVALYAFIIAMPVTGLVAWARGSEAFAELHEIGKLILVPLIALHVAGALAEHFVFRNDTLARMIRPAR